MSIGLKVGKKGDVCFNIQEISLEGHGTLFIGVEGQIGLSNYLTPDI